MKSSLSLYVHDTLLALLASFTFLPDTATPIPTANNPNTLIPRHQQPTDLTVDTFGNAHHNNLKHWHGSDESLPTVHKTDPDHIQLFPTDPDHVYSTVLSSDNDCFNLLPYSDNEMFLHVVFSGTDRFSISINQNNEECSIKRSPFPETADSVEAGRYVDVDSGYGSDPAPESSEGFMKGYRDEERHIYIPLDHFDIDHTRVSSISFHGFYNRSSSVDDTTTPSSSPQTLSLYHVSIISKTHLPPSFTPPPKLPTGKLVQRCTRPNSFAFGIDDGQPGLAQELMKVLEEEDVRVTFFAVGKGLVDPWGNFSEFYGDMLGRGHQVALHSWSHPKLEGLTDEQLDAEITRNMDALYDNLGVKTRYFRPPYGTVGARTRQHLARHIDDPIIVNWSVDVQDWIWVGTDTPERQLEAFVRGVERGGNLAVLHYLDRSTVEYFREMVRFVKRRGLEVMRVDRCLGDGMSVVG